MLRRIFIRLAPIFYRPVAPAVIQALALYTLIWGVWVINPFWEVFSQAGLYSGLSGVAPEAAWGGFAIVCGIAGMFSLRRHWPKVTSAASMAISLHWAIVSLFYFMGDWQNTGGITALFLSILSAAVYLNVMQTQVHPQYDNKNLHHNN